MGSIINFEILLIMLGYAFLNGLGSLLFKIHFRDHKEDNQESLLKLDRDLPKTLWGLIKDWRWTLGEVLLLLDFVVYQIALSRYEVSVVKPLVNLNLIFVLTFGIVIMKEKITKKEIGAISLIVIGSIMISYLSEATEAVPNLLVLFIFVGIVFGLIVAGVILVQRNGQEKHYEFFISVFCGTLYGLGSIFNRGMYQKVYNPILFFIIFLICFAFTYFMAFSYGQYAYSKGRMSMVSTIVNIMSIIVPFIGGILIFGENFIILFDGALNFPGSLIKVFGLLIIIIGVLLAYNPAKD